MEDKNRKRIFENGIKAIKGSMRYKREEKSAAAVLRMTDSVNYDCVEKDLYSSMRFKH